jgi:hypothetical protein
MQIDTKLSDCDGKYEERAVWDGEINRTENRAVGYYSLVKGLTSASPSRSRARDNNGNISGPARE